VGETIAKKRGETARQKIADERPSGPKKSEKSAHLGWKKQLLTVAEQIKRKLNKNKCAQAAYETNADCWESS